MSELSIVGLLFPGRPAAVGGFVGTVIVAAVKRFVCRALTHVREEGVKTVAPTLADGNPTRAITVEPDIFRLAAPALHREPRIVRGGFLSVDDMPVLLCGPFLMVAAICDAPPLQIVETGASGLTAIAQASPTRTAMLVHVRKPHNDEVSEALARQVAEGSHD